MQAIVARVTVNLASGQEVPFQVDKDLGGPAYFVLGIRKCGSSLFNKLVKDLASLNNRRYVNVAGRYFTKNIAPKDWIKDPANCVILYGGNVYGGFRLMPAAFASAPLFREGKKLLMVRDPRDAIVSEYFSNAYSHSIPQRTQEAAPITDLLEKRRREALDTKIDEYVLERARSLLSAYLGYVNELNSASITVVKYEDYIFRKPDLIRLIASDFDMRVDDAQIATIMAWADILPEKETPTAFVRRVTPGDHREKLRPETIAKLNTIMKPAMETFGYAPDA
jgi:Sulfotransferase domain